MSSVQDIPLPVSVATADDLSTSRARTANGRVVSTTGRSTPGDNGAASYIYRRTGRSGQTIDQGAFIAGPGVDDYWEVTRKDVLRLSIYPIDNTGIVDDGYLPLADQVEGETLVVDEGTYLIQTDYTLTRRVHFENGAKFKIANGFTLTLSNGYVATDTQHVFDISDGGVVVVDNMAKVSVAHWGAVPDYVYPSTGTNSSPAIQAAFDAAENIAATKTWREPKRPEVFIPPGSYRLNTGVALLNKPNLYAAGATLVYFGSQASDGAILTIGAFTGTPGDEIELGTFFLPSVTGLQTSPFLIPQANDEFVGIRIDACGSSVFHCELTNYVAIGLQLRPNSKSYVAHNHFLNHKAWACKWAIDFHWRWDQEEAGNFGWSNENEFNNCNFTQDGVTRYLGTTAGTRFRCTNTRPDNDWDFGGCNNNRFFAHCYQPAGELAGTRLAVGLAVLQNHRYFNGDTRQEYICNVAGTVATVPTNTDLGQSSADANGVRFTHCGPYFHAGVFIDKAAGSNMWHGVRWEYGDGAFCYIANSEMQVTNINRGNEIVLYDHARQNSHMEGRVLIDDYTLARRNELIGMKNTARVYGHDLNSKHVISDIHKRFIASAQGLTFKGMQFWNPQNKLIGDYANYGLDDWVLMKNAVQESSFQYVGVVADLSDSRRIGAHFTSAPVPHIFSVDTGTDEIIHNSHGLIFLDAVMFEGENLPGGLVQGKVYYVTTDVTTNRFKVSLAYGGSALNITSSGAGIMQYTSAKAFGQNAVIPLDKDDATVDIPTSTQNDCVSNGWWNSSHHVWLIGGEPIYFGLGANPKIKKAFIGFSGVPSQSTHLELHAVPGGSINSAMLSVSTQDKGRVSVGVPTGGFFLEHNEFIRSYTTEAYSASGWRVKQPGVLSRPWATGVAIKSTELRVSNGKVYAAVNSGTSGATAPTGNLPVPFTADADSNEIIYAAHGLTNGRKVKFSGVYLPGNIIQNSIYYVVGTSTDRFQVSRTSGGTAIDFSSAGHSCTFTALVSDDLIDWEYFAPVAELEEVYEGSALAVNNPPTNGNLTMRSDGSSGNWYRANSYVSTKTLSGDFDISFKVVDIGQSHMVGVTALTQPTEFNNYQSFEFGVLWFGGTTVQISQLAVQKNHTIAGWGNYMVRLVRTGSTLDCYINDVLVSLETATFTANATTNVLTSAGHGLADGRPVRFEGADLPDGIVEGDVYYVRDSTTDTFKIALTLGGAAIDLLDAGSGTQTFFANAIITDDLHVMYSAYDTEDSEAIIYNDDYKPTYQGAAIVSTIEPVQDPDESDVLASTATPTFRWTVFPGRFKSMVLTANVSAMTFMADEAGVYTIAFTQNATGGWTVTWPAGINGVAPDLNLLGGSTTIFTLYYTGSEWHWQDPTPSSRVNVTLVSDGDGVDWDLSNTYVSNDTLSGDFDITFEMVDRQQLFMVGVTTDNVPTSLNNYLNFEYGVYWLSSTGVTIWQNGTSANHTIATWGNGLVRLVRTGTNIDLYINGTLIAAATNASFTASNVRRMYSANANVLSEAILYGDLNTPIAVGSNLVQTNADLPDENGVETVTFSATATFNFAVDPRKHKRMTLTANATGLVVIITEPGIYYIALTQDSTPRTVAFATTINGTQPTMTVVDGESTLFPIYSNGTDLFWI